MVHLRSLGKKEDKNDIGRSLSATQDFAWKLNLLTFRSHHQQCIFVSSLSLSLYIYIYACFAEWTQARLILTEQLSVWGQKWPPINSIM